MKPITETEVVQACQTIFGNDINISREFLHYLQPSKAKSAYRKKAKEHHPDFFAADPLPVQQKQTALFREILHAYDVISLFFAQREGGAWHSSPKDIHERSRREDRRAESSPKPSPTTPGRNTYYQGSIPLRTLQIGQYLYYRGKISFDQLINALVWQRKQRPSMGNIALRWGYFSAEALGKISRASLRPRLFGEKAVALGLLTIFQVNTLLMYQRSQQHQLGQYFLLNNILSNDEMDRLVQELKEHNAALLANSVGKKPRRGSA